MTSREVILALALEYYFVGIPLLFAGVIFGLEFMAFGGAVLALVSIAVIAVIAAAA